LTEGTHWRKRESFAMNEHTASTDLAGKQSVSSVARLIVMEGQGKREVVLGTRTTIGRDSKNCIQILDSLVSKEHCLIQFRPDRGFVIEDLGSSNGTFLNRAQLHGELLLSSGDSINIGATEMVFVVEDVEDKRLSMDDGKELVLLKEIRSKVSPSQERFLPETEIDDEASLRADYEKLRVTYELQRAIGTELDIDRIFAHIIEYTFKFLDCDRAVILMVEESGELKPRALKTRKSDERMIISSTLVGKVRSEKVGFITADALTDKRFECAPSIALQLVRSSMTVPILYDNHLLGIMIIDSSVSVDAYSEKDLSLLTNIANQTAQFMKNAEMAKKIKMDAVTREQFQRLLSPDLAEMVVSGKLKVEKGGENRVSTVLFADIRGFTAMSEKLSASEVLQMLNEYFELMVEIVFHYEGTVDKFVGDMIMVIWGAPVAHNDDPIRAVRAALDMQSALSGYNKIRSVMRKPPINVGIGINTGQLVVGYIGSTRTMSYSVIGDAVNIASRLCSAAKAGEILISEDTCNKLDGKFQVVELAPVHAKGKSKPLKVFSVPG
jgi:adenylate cyclase